MPVLENPKWELFAQKVFLGNPSGRAYAEIYEVDPKLPQTRSSASELRSKPIISQRIEELQREAAKDAIVEVGEVIRELRRIGFADIGEIFDEENGTILHPSAMPEHIRRAVASIEVMEEFEGSGRDRIQIGEVRKIKLVDKNKALENLGRYLKMFTDKVEHSGTVGLADRMKKARERKR